MFRRPAHAHKRFNNISPVSSLVCRPHSDVYMIRSSFAIVTEGVEMLKRVDVSLLVLCALGWWPTEKQASKQQLCLSEAQRQMAQIMRWWLMQLQKWHQANKHDGLIEA